MVDVYAPKRIGLLVIWTVLKCNYHTAGDLSSLNEIIENEEGKSVEKGNMLADDSPTAYEILCDAELLSNLMKALDAIDPVKSEICRMWASGFSERDIAKKLGFKRQSTVNYKRNSALEDLRKLLKDFI